MSRINNVWRFVLGWLLSTVPIVNFLSFGFIHRTFGHKIVSRPGLPPWTGWKGLFIDGVKVFFISLVLFLPALIVFGVGLWYSLPFLLLGLGIVNPFFDTITWTIALAVIGSYFWPASVLGLVQEGRFRAAFSPANLRRAFSVRHFFGWAAGVVTYFGIRLAIFGLALWLALQGLVENLYYMDLLLAPGVLFTTMLVFSWMVGRLEAGPRPPPRARERPVLKPEEEVAVPLG